MTDTPPSGGSHVGAAAPAFNILLAEDSEENRIVMQHYLRKLTGTLTCVDSGIEALSTFQRGPFDLVFLALQLPFMDGLEVTRRMRHWEAGHALAPASIVALTVHAGRDWERQARAAGCTLLLTKPVRKARVLEIVQQCQQRVKVPQETASETDPSTLDQEALAQLYEDLDGEIEPILATFLQRLPDYLATIIDAVRQGDPGAVSQSAHKLKGVAANCGAATLQQVVWQIELMGRSGRVPEEAETSARLSAEGKRTEAALRHYLARLPHA